MTILYRSLVCAVLLSFFAVAASAGTINYPGPDPGPGGMPGWLGDDVWYGGVSESNTEGPGGTTADLFGAPASVTGNAIDFNPTNFVAESTDGGFDITDGQLSFMVTANDGQVIDICNSQKQVTRPSVALLRPTRPSPRSPQRSLSMSFRSMA